jgi:hypothetical protein
MTVKQKTYDAMHYITKWAHSIKEKWNPEEKVVITLTRQQLDDTMWMMKRYLEIAEVAPQRFFALLTYFRNYKDNNK